MYSIAKFIIFVSVSFSFVTLVSAEVKYKDCGSKLGKIDAIAISNCENDPCLLKRGTNVSISMDFTALGNIQTAKTKVYGYLGPLPVPFPLTDDDACHFMHCPETSGAKDHYSMELYVKPEYPKVSVVIKWELVTTSANGDEIDITCFDLPAKIVD